MATLTATRNGHANNGHAIPQGTATRTKITPTQAKQLLARNKHNRAVNQRYVDRYANDMRNGNWKFNGEAIKIATDNTLLDGQHRLLACVESGCTFETLVVTGLPSSVFSCIDIGNKRSGSDVLGMAGYHYTAIIASALQVINSMSLGYASKPKAKLLLTNKAILDLAEKCTGIEEAASFAGANTTKGIIPPSLVAAFLWMFQQTSHSDKAVEFFERLRDGVGLERRSPIRALRERLIANMGATAKLPKNTICAYLIKAWNAYVTGKSLGQLRWGSDEKFPKIEK